MNSVNARLDQVIRWGKRNRYYCAAAVLALAALAWYWDDTHLSEGELRGITAEALDSMRSVSIYDVADELSDELTIAALWHGEEPVVVQRTSSRTITPGEAEVQAEYYFVTAKDDFGDRKARKVPLICVEFIGREPIGPYRDAHAVGKIVDQSMCYPR